MRFILLIIAFAAFSAKAQYSNNQLIDSIQINLLKSSIEMNKFNNQYKKGVNCVLAGGICLGSSLIGIGIAGTIDDNKFLLYLGGISTALIITGNIIMMDSHKYLVNSAIYMKAASGRIGVGITF